ncbi:hypothetical protein ACIVBQ_002697 [Tenacibaculum discolor]
MNSPYISKVKINNFRNFKEVEVNLNHKQVLIGENNVGKSNFLRALQLILDRNFTDYDRMLNATDFHDSIEDPTTNGNEIIIEIEIRGYENNKHLISQFSDAVVLTSPPTLRLTYRYYPLKNDEGEITRYTYSIYKGLNDNNTFTNQDRNFLNIYVIDALRNVEHQLNSKKKSPLYKLVQEYGIAKEDLETISTSIKEASELILALDEINDIKSVIQDKFKLLTGLQRDSDIHLSIYDTEIERLLYTIQLYLGIKRRPISELSLGLSNILFITLILLLLRDKTVPRIIKKQDYEKYKENDTDSLLGLHYKMSTNGDNYLLKNSSISNNELYSFFNRFNNKPRTATILAVEEPESHLHPVLQRLIYREILQKSETSVVFTTHSPYITSVTPLDSIVSGKYIENQTKLYSTVNLNLTSHDKIDIERYLDSKRGEIYFGKGVILVEGITEEYMIPKVADLLDSNLDDLGIIVCNVHSTNFKPYIQILESLNIPWCLITDGDCYKITTEENEDGEKKTYHTMVSEEDSIGFKGVDLIKKILINIEISTHEQIESMKGSPQEKLSNFNCFVGYYTNEVDTMLMCDLNDEINVFKTVYAELRPGGEKQQTNFESELDSKNYWKALKKIDNNISKGRFAQRFAASLKISMVPEYIQNAVNFIVKKVKENHE